ncbi:MAG: hypothetical protein M3O46_10965, partial [Myxococcota bacterium]|nr:hypothetical protein [Myxococcota bacterium]
MRNVRSVGTVRIALAAALGLSSFACGGHESTGVAGPDGGDASPGTNAFSCADPAPMVIGGVDTGYDTCKGGRLRRRSIVDCPNLLPRQATCSATVSRTCTLDTDCAA